VQVVFLTRARADFLRLRQFLEPHGELVAKRAVDTLFTAARSLADLPERGRPAVRPPYRELIVPFGAGAYVIRYRVDHRRNTVVITRIWHGRERRR
jgi:plasmid stabilization system protein ParE